MDKDELKRLVESTVMRTIRSLRFIDAGRRRDGVAMATLYSDIEELTAEVMGMDIVWPTTHGDKVTP